MQLQVTNVIRDSGGTVLSSEETAQSGVATAVNNSGPLLTLDWDRHRSDWLDGWPTEAEPSTGERTISSGVTAVVFTVLMPFVVPTLGIDATSERHQGYRRSEGSC